MIRQDLNFNGTTMNLTDRRRNVTDRRNSNDRRQTNLGPPSGSCERRQNLERRVFDLNGFPVGHAGSVDTDRRTIIREGVF